MSVGGWIKLYRKFLDWEWFTDSKMVQLFVYLLLSASIEQRKWRGIVLERGQLATTVAELSEKTNLTAQNLRTALARLENSQIINRQTTNKYTIITICNFESYQAKEESAQQSNNNPATNGQQSINNQTTGTIAKEGEEGIKREEGITTITTTILDNNIPHAPAHAREKVDFLALPEEQQQSERAAFLASFYWANIWRPAKEVEKFIRKNQGKGWRSGDVVFDTPAQRLALAGMWAQDDRCPKDRDKYISVLRQIYDDLLKLRPDLAPLCIDDRNGIEFLQGSDTVVLHYPKGLVAYFKEDETGAAIVRNAINPNLKIEFSNKIMPRTSFK